jgi:calcineurin-like phosphoesterase family protein
MKYEKLVELYVKNLSAPDERMRTDSMGEERGNRPQTRFPEAWGNFKPIANKIKWEGHDAFLLLNDRDFNKIWIWSDLHFFHNNIIRYTSRPFSDTDHMNRSLLENYRSVVGKDDVSIWVGDVTFERGGTHITNTMLASLPGYKILVFGNHDLDKTGTLRNLLFDEVHSVYQLGNLIFSHYPWNFKVPDDHYNIHGHTHDKNTGKPRHVNVSVERLGYTPISLATLIEQKGLNYKEEV